MESSILNLIDKLALFFDSIGKVAGTLISYLGVVVSNIADIGNCIVSYIGSGNSIGAITVSVLAVIGIIKLVGHFL